MEDVPEHENFAIYVRGADPVTLVVSRLVEHYLYVNKFSVPVIVVPYLPAARSDRGDYRTLPMYLALLSGSAPISALDIHNPQAECIVDDLGVVNYSALDAIKKTNALPKDKYAGVIAPDEGAFKRASEVAAYLGVPIYHAEKERDFETGKIIGLIPPEQELDPSLHYLVVDDIFDGGFTFRVLAEALNLPKLDLWVTHGIFSGNWRDNLVGYYKNIYTTNSHPGVDKFRDAYPYTIGKLDTAIYVIDIKPFMIGEIE